MAGVNPAARLPKAVYAVNIVPVFAVAINVYEINSMTRDTRAVLRSRRGEEEFLFSTVVMVIRPVASVFGRAEARSADSGVDDINVASCIGVPSGSSTTGGRGLGRVDGVESRMGGDTLLNREITADQLCQ